MIRAPYRYVLMNGQTPMMQRKRFIWFGWWYNYEPFANHLTKLEDELNELDAKIQKEYDAYAEKQKEGRAIVNRVNNAKGEMDGEGHVLYKKFPLFSIRHKPIPAAGKRWRRFLEVLEHGKTAQHKPTDGMENVREVGGNDDFENTSIDGHSEEVMNQKSHNIKPHKDMSNKERKRQQQQQQQNNQQ